MLYRILFPVLALAVYVSSVQAAPAPALTVVASVRPLTLLINDLTQGAEVEVKTLLPRGATPHDYALKPSDLKAVAAADLVLWLGPASEPYLKKIVTNAANVIKWEARPNLLRLPVRESLHEPHGHGQEHHDDHDHHGAGFDPHFWFSVDNALVLVDGLAKQLMDLQPQQAAIITQNKARLIERLQQQRTQSSAIASIAAAPFILSHDAYHYLEEDLGIHSAGAISMDPEIKPGVKHLMAIKKRVEEDKIRCVITDPSVSSALLDKVDVQPPLTRVSIDPLGWDYDGSSYAEWISSVYVKMVVCVTAQ